jgi:hypothetical protein
MARVLIAAGLVLVLAGVAAQFGLPLGRLPGDIIIRRGSGTFYLPIVTCVIVSIVLTIIAALVKR